MIVHLFNIFQFVPTYLMENKQFFLIIMVGTTFHCFGICYFFYYFPYKKVRYKKS